MSQRRRDAQRQNQGDMLHSKLRLALLATIISAPIPAQTQSSATFEVASIKVAKPGINGVRGGCHGIDSVYTPGESAAAPPLGRCVITDARLSHMVGIAWDVTMPMLKTGPDWIQRGDLRFNVEAEAANPTKTTERQLLAMLQALLIERFQMKYHWEPVTLSGFAVTVTKGGAKLKESTAQDSEVSISKGKPGPDNGILKVKRVSMRDFVKYLSMFGNRGPGVDHTGLTGIYDIDFEWDDNNGPSLETALKQLGLRMQGEKVATQYFVIDSAHEPSAN